MTFASYMPAKNGGPTADVTFRIIQDGYTDLITICSYTYDAGGDRDAGSELSKNIEIYRKDTMRECIVSFSLGKERFLKSTAIWYNKNIYSKKCQIR